MEQSRIRPRNANDVHICMMYQYLCRIRFIYRIINNNHRDIAKTSENVLVAFVFICWQHLNYIYYIYSLKLKQTFVKLQKFMKYVSFDKLICMNLDGVFLIIALILLMVNKMMNIFF